MIGYCPQFDSIVDVMTGREMLSLFAHIRGVPAAKRKEEVGKWLDFVGLRQYADRRCGTYSGGNKRKLNVAQALVGDPVSAQGRGSSLIYLTLGSIFFLIDSTAGTSHFLTNFNREKKSSTWRTGNDLNNLFSPPAHNLP